MTNNSLAETGNGGMGLVSRFKFYFVDLVFLWFFYLLLYFLSKRCSLIQKYKKRQFIILAESVKNTLEGKFSKKYLKVFLN